MTDIAVVGMACRYPDALSPRELWDNAVAGRRAFRRLPNVRMRLDDYWDADPTTPDRFYSRTAAVIEGYEFDRIAYKIAGSTFRSTDLTHWLALDVAASALADAGFPMAEGLPRERTSVVVGNSLTGEFSRAGQLRLRWPYVRRVVAAALKEQNWDDDQLSAFLTDFEARYKSPFPVPDEDTLAGGLSNTIAGRICNHFDLKGGGYTVDGACSSSLLSVATACKTLIDGEIDVAIAGGVDLSIDPFEIVGFAKTGALARSEMRVYDQRSNGFWPGEGCGMIVLMREADAIAAGHRVYATVAGWGISSDGKGGITRPEVGGYQLALRRAYERAGFGIDTVGLFEGHGTGTPVGDATELEALGCTRRAAGATEPAAISSIKGMIGHTKAAAGVAGLIKAAMAVHHEVLPPAIGCVEPHDLLTSDDAALRVLARAEQWPSGTPVRAGITAMGFGGINTHVVLEKRAPRRPSVLDGRTRTLASARQDRELLLLDAASAADLRARVQQLLDFVLTVSYAQLTDLAATLYGELRGLPYRAAVVVSSPEDAEARLRQLAELLDAGETHLIDGDGRAFLHHSETPGRIGYLFPGQGSGRGTSGGALRRRFSTADRVYRKAALPTGGDTVATAVAQPRIVTGSMAGLAVLTQLGLEATVAVGHSLGELSALHWAGAMDAGTLLHVAAERGATMAEHSASGTMAGVAAAPETVAGLIAGTPLVIAGYNGPQQTVVSGPVDDVERLCEVARAAGLSATPLPVSHAFHSPLVAPAAGAFAGRLAEQRFRPLDRQVVSTVTGETMAADIDVPLLLHRQITDPVLFAQAVELAAKDIDLFVEVGPGRVLSGLAHDTTGVPAVALDTDDESIGGLLRVLAAAYVTGAAEIGADFFHGRLVRPLEIGKTFTFFASPCEQAPTVDVAPGTPSGPAAPGDVRAPAGDESVPSLELLCTLAAERAELPAEMVGGDSRLLDDLHLSSITVGQIVNQAAQRQGLNAAQAPTNFATATIGELAQALDELRSTTRPGQQGPAPVVTGAAGWVRAFAVDADEAAPPESRPRAESGPWELFARPADTFAAAARTALTQAGVGTGVLVSMPSAATVEDLALALDGARTAIAGQATRFVLLQRGRGAAGLAKTLRLEAPDLRVTVITAPDGAITVPCVVDEVAATDGFAEVRYDDGGTRLVPVLRPLPVRAARHEGVLGPDDVLLVTGGGKGITAECGLTLAADSGARLVVLGRSAPAPDTELDGNLRRAADRGVDVHYVRADVTDPEQVRLAVAEAVDRFGPVTAVLHGAGRNEPAALAGLDMAAFRSTLAPKADGLAAVLAAVEPDRLKLLVTFGSIIGRAGLRGEAHYATANDWLAELTAEFGREHPGCRSLCLEWSVWSGVGMGERLSVVENLAREGVTPVSVDEGLATLRRLVADPDAPPVVVVSGRTQSLDTVGYEEPELPLLRFVDKPLVRYHGVELVVETTLNSGADLYLTDHLLDGNMLFPAVFGLEAMAQVAVAVTGRAGVPRIDRAEFARPIVVPPDGSTTIRVAAVVTGDGEVDVVIRSAETGFAVDHFQARLVFDDAVLPAGPPEQTGPGLPEVPLDPARDLYGSALFQGALFQRLIRFHRAAAKHVDADLAVRDAGWFAGYLPPDLLLGDPGTRDALMHGNQVCVPDATLLPAGIERVRPSGPRPDGTVRYSATERSRDGDTYVYDIAVRDAAGAVIERWDGLRLRAVRKKSPAGPWVPLLLGSYLERALDDLWGTGVAVAVEPDERREATALALGRVSGQRVEVRHRPDGAVETDLGRPVSISHGAGLTLCVAGDSPIGCDVEPVTDRDATVWRQLLGQHERLAQLIRRETGDDADTAATRVWTAIECLQKAGRPGGGPLTLVAGGAEGWVLLGSGELRIATFVTTVQDRPQAVVLAVLAGKDA
ncbi:erythronolide synthase [Actinoplanes sp. ATCC 53533]|uniref:type I polyketide synthase n=1 Tax=Actinoplanes sp. ATCC 53533 TaxID=1288362 RepID=UPI000F7951D1|nr:type I polyketide synthase [Actinoplanes sp. ATCC 53533]RSM47505.1 erythronolide synthase [Actinoplanes sp. ATCC 53533]